MSGKDSIKRFPDWKKVFVAILEKQIEAVLGENAINEIKQPYLQKELSEKLGNIYDTVKNQFVQQVENPEIRDAVLSLPLASLPTIQQAIAEFFQQPQSDKLKLALKKQLISDYPQLPKEQVDAAVHHYVKILHDELVPLSKEFREMNMTYSIAQISDHTKQLETITSLLTELVTKFDKPPIAKRDNKQVEIRLKGEFEEFTTIRAQYTVSVLAAVLEVEKDQIQIIRHYQGSIVIVIVMPNTAADKLYELARKQDSELIELGIESVYVEDKDIVILNKEVINNLNENPERLSLYEWSGNVEEYMSSRHVKHIDFILITALEEERDALLSKLPGYRPLPPSNEDINFYYLAELSVTFTDNSTGKYSIIVLSLLGMGRVQAATATTNAIHRWKPRFVLLVGIAGGVEAKGVKLGDILISDQIVDYELQKITPEGPEIRWDVYKSSPRLLAASKSLPTEKAWENLSVKRPKAGQSKRHVGPIASGDKVVAFGEVLDKYRENWPKLIGVEMEAAGVAMAAFQAAAPPGFFLVRAVSDLADSNKDTPHVEKWRSYACDAAAAYTIALLKSGPVLPQIVDRYSRSVAPPSQVRPEWTEYEHYPWRPFMSYRYLESLDSTRFNNLSRDPEIKMLNGKSELLEALLFGDGIALSEPQLIDSRGAVDALGELIEAAKDVKVRIPIRLASRNPSQSVFDLASSNIGNIDETQLNRRYVISANPALDLDINRRKSWSEQLTQGMQGLDGLLMNCSTSEAEFVTSLFTTLNYIDHEGGFVIPARNEPDRFYREVEQVLSLTSGDLIDMCQQKRDADIPEIMHPQWFANQEEANAASELIAGLRSIVNKLGGIPKGRSPIYTELAGLEKENPILAEDIKEVVDSIYNHVVGLAGNADSLSDTTSGDAQNNFVRAGHALSQWARQTEKKADGEFTYELPWGWGGASQLTWSNRLEMKKIQKVIKAVPWQAILEATKEPTWQESLANYRTSVDILQAVDRNGISLGTMGKQWRQKHLDAHKALNEAWQKHIELSARLISNEYWKLTLDGMQYYVPESGNRPLPAIQNYRTMGTMSDFPIEMQQFRMNIVQRMEFERNIYGMINEIAQKRQH